MTDEIDENIPSPSEVHTDYVDEIILSPSDVHSKVSASGCCNSIAISQMDLWTVGKKRLSARALTIRSHVPKMV